MICRCLAMIGFVLVLPAAALAQERPAKDDARALDEHVRKVVRQAEPSVVAVIVSHAKYPTLPTDGTPRPGKLGKYLTPTPNRGVVGFFPPEQSFDPKLDLSDPQNVPDNLFGSGLVLDADGLILTPYHLVEGASKIYVRTSAGRGSYADFHAYDARSDLAVLRLIDPPAGLKAIKIGNVRVSEGPNGEQPTVARGTFLLSLGHPLAAGAGDGSASVSFGVLSNVRRRVAGPRGEDLQKYRALHHYGMLLQTDARITLGCSGAALLNLDGELIGITTPMAAVTGAETAGGYALPMDANYRRIIDVLRAGREVEYGFLGVTFNRDLGHTRLETGLKLEQVTPGTPAHAAGLVGVNGGRLGDSIVAIEGNPIKEQDDLFLFVGAALAGTKVNMTVLRDGRTRPVEVTLAKFDHPLPWLATVKSPAVHGLRVDYSSVMLLRANLAGGPSLPAGVSVRELEPSSAAAQKFKPLAEPANRWLITHVNSRPVTSPAEFYREAQGQPSIKLRLYDPNPNATDRDREIQLP